MTQDYKTCTKCGRTLPLTSFHKHKPASDGRKPRCKECRCASSRRYRQEHRDECAERDREYYKGHADAIKEYNRQYREQNKQKCAQRDAKYRAANKDRLRLYHQAYYRDNRKKKISYARKWAKRHKEHRKRYLAHYRATNEDVLSEYFKSYRAENPEKIRAKIANYRARRNDAAGSYSSDQWQRLCALFGSGCARCQKTDEPLEADHIIPLTWEGTSNWIENIQPLCKSCNSSKGNHRDTDHRPIHIRMWAQRQMDIEFFRVVAITISEPEV